MASCSPIASCSCLSTSLSNGPPSKCGATLFQEPNTSSIPACTWNHKGTVYSIQYSGISKHLLEPQGNVYRTVESPINKVAGRQVKTRKMTTRWSLSFVSSSRKVLYHYNTTKTLLHSNGTILHIRGLNNSYGGCPLIGMSFTLSPLQLTGFLSHVPATSLPPAPETSGDGHRAAVCRLESLCL